MKPYVMTLTSDEMSILGKALKAAKFIASQCEAYPGLIEDKEEIAAAVDMFDNHKVDGGYESQAERDVAFWNSTAEFCAKHGCD